MWKPEYADRFRSHFSTIFKGDQLQIAMKTIAVAFVVFGGEMVDSAETAKTDARDHAELRDWRKIAKHVAALRRLLQRRPILAGIGADFIADNQSSLRRLAWLAYVATAPRPRGTRKEEWRDKLIATVRGIYTDADGTVIEHTHFVQTVVLALEILDPVSNVYAVIQNAERHPECPLSVDVDGNVSQLIKLPAYVTPEI